jgi:glycosyltransferase involved in cell wall biosynthesis
MEGALPQDRLATLMGTSFAAILPCIVAQSGDRDGLPTVLLEAMARALPVITTTVSGGPEIVEEGRTGLLCQPGDPAALADAIEAMLARPEEARQMGLAGRARAESLFDLHRNVARLHALLRDPRGAQHIGREAA